MNLFELFVKIGVDDQASGKISKISQGLGNGLKTAAKVGAAAVGAASTAIVALGKIGLEYNSQMEQYTTNFTTMLGSQEAAVKKVEELKKFAASTPLSMDDLAKGTQTLLAFGVESENSTAILRQLGDIALGDADKMQRLSTAFGKATASGKVTGDTVQQMIDAGWNPLIQISQAAGETMEETQKRMSAGAVSVEELQAAMEAVTSGTGQFAGGMEAASHTTQGLISTLKDNANALVGDVFMPISEGLLGEVLPSAIEAVSSLTTAFEENGISGMIEAAGEIVGKLLTGIAENAPRLIESGADLLISIIDGLVSEGNTEGLAEAALNIVETLSEKLIELAGVLGEAAFELVDALGNELSEKIPGLSVVFENLETVVISLTAAFVAYKAATAISGIIDALRKATEGQTIAQTLLNAVMNANPFVLIATLIAGLVAAIITLWNTNDGFREAVIGIWESIKGAFVGAWEAIKSAWSVVKDFFADIWNGIKSTFSVVGNTIGGFFTDAWEKTKQGWSVAGNFFSNVWGGIKSTFSVVGNVLGSFFTDAWNKIKSAFSSWKNFFSNLWSQVKNVFSGAGSWFLSIGKDIVNGVWSGIQSMVSWFTNKVKSFFSGIVNSVKNVLGIHSPSKVFASIGGYMAEGLGEGWDDKFSDVRDEIDKSLDFDDPSMSINASVRKIGAEAAGISGAGYGGTSIGNVTINIDGARYSNENSLAEAIAEALQNMTDRRAAVYA